MSVCPCDGNCVPVEDRRRASVDIILTRDAHSRDRPTSHDQQGLAAVASVDEKVVVRKDEVEKSNWPSRVDSGVVSVAPRRLRIFSHTLNVIHDFHFGCWYSHQRRYRG